MDEKKLMDAARAARSLSYSPYSGFAVGAALLCRDGEIYPGANVENAAYPSTSCAEHAAVVAALLAGHRDFAAIAVSGGKAGEEALCAPCGNCRQVLREFCSGDFVILFSDGQGSWIRTTLAQLLPESFGPENLES